MRSRRILEIAVLAAVLLGHAPIGSGNAPAVTDDSAKVPAADLLIAEVTSQPRRAQQEPLLRPDSRLAVPIIPFRVEVPDGAWPKSNTHSYLSPLLLHASLAPKSDAQDAIDAVAGKTVRFFINDKFVGQAVSRPAGYSDFVRKGDVYLWIPQHSARNLNLGVGTHKLTAETGYGNASIKGHGEWRVEQAGTQIISPQIMPVKSIYTIGETITMGGILRNTVSDVEACASSEVTLQPLCEQYLNALDILVGSVDLRYEPFPIPNATVNCLVVQGRAQDPDRPFTSGPPPAKAVSSTRTNSQGGFECNFVISLDMFDLVSSEYSAEPKRAVSCSVYKAEGLAVSFEGNQNYRSSGRVYGFAGPGRETYEWKPFYACSAGTSHYSGSHCPSNCSWGCCK
jgi:hypothetical protein